MENSPQNIRTPKKIGQYLSCDLETINQGLKRQQQLAYKGAKKLLGEVLLDLKAITRENLKEAIHLQRFDLLKISKLFGDLSDDDLKNFSQSVHDQNVPAGETFIHQETSGDCLFIIAKGQAEVYRVGEYEEEIRLGVLGPGDCVGEMGFFSQGRRSASVRALVDSQVIRINYEDLKKAFEYAPSIAKNFLSIVTNRLVQLTLRFQEIVQKGRAIEKSLENLRNFLDLSEILALRVSIEELINRTVLIASKVMNADRATLFLIDAVAGELWSKVAEGEESREIRIPIGSGIAGWVAQHNQMLNIDDAYADPRFNPEVDKRTNYRTKSILCGPIINLQGETLGVIQVINKKAVHLTGTMKPFSRPLPIKQPLPSKTFSSTKRFCPVMKKWQSCWMWPPLCHRR